MTGPRPQPETLQLVANSHLFLFPSLSESFGMALDEAVAIGLPTVVFSGVGPITSTLPTASTVFVQDIESVAEWAGALQTFHAQSDVLLAAATAEAEQRTIKRNSARNSATSLTDIVFQLCDREDGYLLADSN